MPVDLSGLARSGGTAGWGSAVLQRRRYGETVWTTIGATLPNGAWTDAVTPITRTDYRAVSGNATGSARRVFVRTRVAFSAPVSPYTTLKGSVGPARSGIVVTLERRRTDGTWAFRGTKTTASNGSFSFTVSQTGTYRARADAGNGFLEGSALVTTP